MTQTPSTFIFSGGLDVATSPLVMPPGRIMSGMNYEVVAEGYRRVDGYERFDGRKAPSDARFWSVPFQDGATPIYYGDVVFGATSGAGGIVVAPPLVFSGAWIDGTAAGTLVLGEVVGEFDESEALTVEGAPRARTNGYSGEGVGPDADTRRERLAMAQEWRRNAITQVPGSGDIRGVAIYKGVVYAWRDNLEGTACAMWRASVSGWLLVPLGRTLRFTEGLLEILDGATITGSVSGATATAARVVAKSGDWGSNKAGYIVLTGATGTFIPNETIAIGSTPYALAGADTPTTLPPGGRYQTIVHNFYGAKDRLRLYGISGAGRAFEFDGTIFAPIETGMTQDIPFLLFEVAEHLGLVFKGGSVQLSVPGEPLLWDAAQGAFEFGFGSEVTNVVSSNDSAVALFGTSRIGILSGRDADTFQFDELTEEAGADPWSAQRIGRTIYIDQRGLRDLSATQAYGNFRAGSLLPELLPFFQAKRKSGAKPVLSFVAKGKSQYRVIWSDGSGLSVFMGRKTPEPLLFSVAPIVFTCGCAGELADGEGIFAGGTGGYVYRLDSGPSLDGIPVQAFVMTPFNHLGGVMVEKRLHKTTVEMDNPPDAQVGISVIFDYGDESQPMSGSREFYVRGTGGHDLLVTGGGGIWDTGVWDNFFWSAPLKGKAEAYTEGQGVNMAVVIGCDSHVTEVAHTLQAYTLHWSPRKMRR